jgi:hypothetical protein
VLVHLVATAACPQPSSCRSRAEGEGRLHRAQPAGEAPAAPEERGLRSLAPLLVARYDPHPTYTSLAPSSRRTAPPSPPCRTRDGELRGGGLRTVLSDRSKGRTRCCAGSRRHDAARQRRLQHLPALRFCPDIR